MTLKDFLQTVPELTDADALIAARNYFTTEGKLLEASTVNGWLSSFKLLPVVKQIVDQPTHPAHSDILAVWVALLGNHQFNFKIGSLTGDGQIAALNRLINTDLTEHAAELTMFKDTALYFANTVSYPFANVTLHDVMIVRGTCPTVPLVSDDGWAVITTTADAPEAHRPQLSYLNPRTNKLERATNFPLVTVAGTYECQVPKHAFGNELFVDNAYGVL